MVCCCLVSQVVSDSSRPRGLWPPRLLCPSPSPGVCPSSWRVNQHCHSTVSFSVTLFSFCLQSFPASGSFSVSHLFTSGSQSIEASASVLPKSIQGWFPLTLTGLISLLSKGLWCTVMLRKKHIRDFWWCVANRGDKCMKLSSSFKMHTHSGWLEQCWFIPFVSV